MFRNIKLSWVVIGVVFVAILAILAYQVFFADTKVAGATQNFNVRICHATPPDTAANGWVNNYPANIGVLVGHATRHDADIIPPFGQYPGKNWGDGEAIWENDCEVPKEEVCPEGQHEVEPVKNEAWVDQEYELVCEKDVPPVETWSPRPDGQKSTTEAPVCTDGSTVNLPANIHVVRNGVNATVNFFITEGDRANIFYSVVGQPHWQHAVADVKPVSENFVSYTIHDLDANLGYDFGIQQVQGCGGGKTTAVVVDGPAPMLFQFSYWE